MSTELLFYVLADGKEYRIYANGKTEGFGNDVRVFNRFPLIYSDGLRLALAHALECPECRTGVQPSEQNQDREVLLPD
jgi:hypothetical protein